MKNLSVVFVLFLSLFLTACGDSSQDNSSDRMSEEEKMEEESMDEQNDASSSEIKLTAFTPSPSYDNAKISNLKYSNGTLNYTIPEGEYKLGEQTSDADVKMCANSAKGQHIHLIVDNEPYSAHYTSEFDYDFENGTHHILTFLSRSYHESIKTAEAHRAMKVKVKDGSFTSMEPIKQPTIFYSRPKGTYVGEDTKKVMLDFYPVNAPIGQAYTIKAVVNDDKEFMINEWKPYYLENLPMGENTVKLTLMDRNGEAVDSPLNPVSRTITLKKDPAENM